MNDFYDRFGNLHSHLEAEVKTRKKKTNLILPIILFIVTFITSTIAGMQWIIGYGTEYDVSKLALGLPYSISIIFVLGCHEFGHYFASMYHKVKATLPNFIPFPPIPGVINFGTLGAVIKTKDPVGNNKALFDIGVTGPISGFIASVGILVYGFLNLPPESYLLNIHPDFYTAEYGKDALSLTFGDSLLFAFLREVLTSPADFVPPMSEIYHYPYLTVGWFGIFVTAMNLVPVGQLDGGHVFYSLFGEKVHKIVAVSSMIALVVLGVLGVISVVMDFDTIFGWSGWLFWALILYFFIKVKHPPVQNVTELGPGRKAAGYFAIFIFIVSFIPAPFVITV